MPLIKSKSKEAFKHNLKAELAAGKPLKQSLAIAYSEKKDAGKKHHSSHIEELGSAYESNSVSGGPRQSYHPTVTMSREPSNKERE